MTSKSQRITAPYGGWDSPFSAAQVARGALTRDFPCQVDGVIYWQETRPQEEGRTTVVARNSKGECRDLLPYPESTQSTVHEYGGKSWIIAEGQLFYVAKKTQRVYSIALPSPRDGAIDFTPRPLTPKDVGLRFADFCWDGSRQRLIAVCERHFNDDSKPENFLIAIPIDGSGCDADNLFSLASGADFYAYPRLSPQGTDLAWISWNHPQMPWDGTALWRACIDDLGRLCKSQLVAGGATESIFQPSWSPAGTLHFVSDRTGWWNLYRQEGRVDEPLFPTEAEFATPLWSLGMSTYGFIDEHHIATLFTQNGDWHLGILNTLSGTMEMCGTGYSQLTSLDCSAAGDLLLIQASPTHSGEVALIAPPYTDCTALTPSTFRGQEDMVSIPRPVSFMTSDEELAHGFYYPPTNARYRGSADEKPPLIVLCHGGPTGASYATFNYKVQYWTSRGFALLDLNYRGSTGFGRHYRKKLDGRWGVADIEDVIAGVDYLATEGLIDPRRAIIRGSSAGGYTVLAALAFSETFAAGASLYGIGDLEALARDTHKFEAHYMDSLVGPYPKERDRYRQRSPLYHVDKLNCPVIFLQGLEDRVVPPNQAEAMVEALKSKGLAVAYVSFSDEAHGFRKAENIQKALEAELYFYRAVLGIPSGETLPPTTIYNLPSNGRMQ